MQEVGAMTKTAFPVLAIWAAALGSAGALAYTLNRPPRPVANAGDHFAIPPPTIDRVVSEPITPPSFQTELAPAVVVQKTPRAHPRPRAVPTEMRDLSEPQDLSRMHCTAWGDLMQGSASQQVRRCD
jgi:hypothetical protein